MLTYKGFVTIILTNLLELFVLLYSIIMQQYTLQYTDTVVLLYSRLQTNVTSHMWP